MEFIAPTLKMVLFLRARMESGHSLKSALRTYLEDMEDECARQVRVWLIKWEQGVRMHYQKLGCPPLRMSLFELFEMGLDGQPIIERLYELEKEILEACRYQIERHVQLLPFKTLIPLLLFQFPALLILLFGPVLNYMREAI